MLVDTKFPPYQRPNAEPGYGGFKPEHAPARDLWARDPKTGRIVREVIDSPENINSTRVRRLHARGNITDRQLSAADRYAADYQQGEMIVIASVGTIRTSTGWAQSTLSDAKLDAQRRYGLASSVLGRCKAVVELVVLNNMLLEIAAASCKIHHQKAAGYLECGLDLLADHYRLAP